MKVLERFKLGSRLFGLGVIALIITVIINFTASVSIGQITDFATDSSNKYTRCLENIYQINDALGKENIEVRNIIWIYDPQARVSYKERIDTQVKAIDENVTLYKSMMEQGRFESLKSKETSELDNFKQNLVEFQAGKDEIIRLVEAGQNNDAQVFYDEKLTPLSEKASNSISNLYNLNLEEARLVSASNAQIGNSVSTTLFILVTVLSIILFVFIGLVTLSITKPMKELINSSGEMAKGKLVQMQSVNYRNELGDLSRNFTTLTDTIKALLSDLEAVVFQHKAGNINYVIDADKYEGIYGQVAAEINDLVTIYNADMRDAIQCVSEMGNGNFSATLATFPGEKVYINKAVLAVQNNLKAVVQEINGLAELSANGKLDGRANIELFKGGWKQIMIGINGMLEAIVEPIKESSDVLKEMAQGNLKVKVTGNYKGHYEEMKNSLNKTIDAVSLYISDISHVLSRLATDDYTESITREYVGDFVSIKDSINMIVDKLNGLIIKIRESSTSVNVHSGNIDLLSKTLEQESAHQKDSIANLTQMVSSLRGKTDENTKSAQETNEIALATKENAQKGANEMSHMVDAMTKISESSCNIANIIKVIDDIAFQTNLLALNAAVEAARAGTHGKGFAVVAEEVRTLATKSKEAAARTNILIGDSLDKIKQGTSIAASTSSALNEIINGVSAVSDNISNIVVSFSQQQSEISIVNDTINEISVVTLNNSNTAANSAAAVSRLREEADKLDEMLEYFTLRQQ